MLDRTVRPLFVAFFRVADTPMTSNQHGRNRNTGSDFGVVSAVRFRFMGNIDAQLQRSLECDGQADIVTIDDNHPTRFGADDWLLVRANDLSSARSSVAHEDLCVDLTSDRPMCATYRGTLIPLTPLELRVLYELVRANAKPVSRDNLLLYCWKIGRAIPFARLEALICRLRKRLVEQTHLSIRMDRSIGYRLTSRGPRRR